eukprot:TRINITY_DN66422_c9_g3_i2.p3 TRINITY_DN66422_c9_g3~~TRINITY_DN66422_c9_g3_i2.p3  ORF type:complete len:334 (-),score=164.86 TRINITY_DN66422_c9_g3_i2:1722-2693(-)
MLGKRKATTTAATEADGQQQSQQQQQHDEDNGIDAVSHADKRRRRAGDDAAEEAKAVADGGDKNQQKDSQESSTSEENGAAKKKAKTKDENALREQCLKLARSCLSLQRQARQRGNARGYVENGDGDGSDPLESLSVYQIMRRLGYHIVAGLLEQHTVQEDRVRAWRDMVHTLKMREASALRTKASEERQAGRMQAQFRQGYGGQFTETYANNLDRMRQSVTAELSSDQLALLVASMHSGADSYNTHEQQAYAGYYNSQPQQPPQQPPPQPQPQPQQQQHMHHQQQLQQHQLQQQQRQQLAHLQQQQQQQQQFLHQQPPHHTQ